MPVSLSFWNLNVNTARGSNLFSRVELSTCCWCTKPKHFSSHSEWTRTVSQTRSKRIAVKCDWCKTGKTVDYKNANSYSNYDGDYKPITDVMQILCSFLNEPFHSSAQPFQFDFMKLQVCKTVFMHHLSYHQPNTGNDHKFNPHPYYKGSLKSFAIGHALYLFVKHF